MRKTLLTLSIGIASYCYTSAQVSNYSFAQSSGTYTAITGGTVLGDTTSDDQRFVDPAALAGSTSTLTGVGFPIGFNFSFNGEVFDRFAVNNNGWISLGKSSLTPSVNINSSSSYTAISATSTATPAYLRSRIAAFAKDLDAQTGSELRVQTTGSAPNRVCVIQWKNYRKYSFSNNLGDNLNFQIRLKETSNVVEVVYGTFTNNSTTALGQVGLGGSTNTDFNNRKTTTNWASTTAGTADTSTMYLSATVKPASGQTYTWTPPPMCSGTPIAGTVSGTDSICSGTDFDLMVTGYTPNVSGLTFQWQWSATLGGTYTNIANETSSTLTTSQTANTYYKCVVTCSGASATTAAHFVKMSTFLTCYCTVSPDCSLDDEILNVTFGTINNTTTCATNGYSLTTTSVPTINAGSTYPISVKVGSGGTEHVAVWIDYNRNGVFDPTEFKSIGSGDSAVVSSTIVVPSTALSGVTVMRVRARYNTALVDTAACYEHTYGETEDYLVNVVGASGVGIEENDVLNNFVIYPNPTAGVFNIAVTGGKFNELAINVIDMQGKVVYSISDKNTASGYNKRINLEGLAKGIYYVKLNTELGVKVQKLVIQ